MANRCKTCSHPKRVEIEEDLLNSVPYRSIGEKYGLSHTSVRRHFENGHIAEELVKASKLKRIAYSENLLDKLLFLQHQALKILDEAKKPEEGKPLLNTALNAIAKVHSMLETQGKLAGQLREQEVNILVNPTWIGLKQEIFAALEPFPDAKRAVFVAVAGADISDVEKKMFAAEPEHKPITPAILEIINREFQGAPEQHPELLPVEIYEKQKKTPGRKLTKVAPLVEKRKRYRCIKAHSFHGKRWSVGMIWDSAKPDGPRPGGNNWELDNPAEKPQGLQPTRRRQGK